MIRSYFSLQQMQELELQALIYRYMLAGATVPPELLQLIKKSLLHSPYFLHHHYSFYQPTLYWGRANMDPEPGRCRRTDGKKWRCSRDVVAGHKYCERHVHRGRNRSRKHVEISKHTITATTVNGGGSVGCRASSLAELGNGASVSVQSPSLDPLHSNQCSLDSGVGNRSGGRILRPFLNDWPRSVHNDNGNTGSNDSSSRLSISMPRNLPSDVSLKLSTGNFEEPSTRRNESENWGSARSNHAASIGGPLAEALRSSTSKT